LLVSGTDGAIRFIDATTADRQEIRLRRRQRESSESVVQLQCPDAILSLALSASGNELVAGFAGGAQVWNRDARDVNLWREGARIEAETGIYRTLIYSSADASNQHGIVVTGDLHGNVRYWHLATGEPIGPPLPNQGMVTMLLLDDQRDGTPSVLAGTISGSIRRWPLPTGATGRARWVIGR
jgi:WD40 repeat protein